MALAPSPPWRVIPQEEPDYPISDGKPVADSTQQFQAIGRIAFETEAMFLDEPNVAVHADLFWYTVRGDPRACRAPDTMVIFGRPKAMRQYYKQWEEDNIPPQVVFEVKSDSNTPSNLEGTFQFYDRHGVEEYYLYDPVPNTIQGWQRRGRHLEPIRQMQGWVSPRLGIRFEVESEGVVMYRPDGRRFRNAAETVQVAALEELRANREQARADQAEAAAETERDRAARAASETEVLRQQAAAEAAARRVAEEEMARAQAEVARLLARLQSLEREA